MEGSNRQKSMEALRQCSLGIQCKRDLINAFNTFVGKSEDYNKVSEIKQQVIRFWGHEKSKEKLWVEHISTKVLLPLFQKYQRTTITEEQKVLFTLYRPIEICRSNIEDTFTKFKNVINSL
jgi:hypothetical protein